MTAGEVLNHTITVPKHSETCMAYQVRSVQPRWRHVAVRTVGVIVHQRHARERLTTIIAQKYVPLVSSAATCVRSFASLDLRSSTAATRAWLMSRFQLQLNARSNHCAMCVRGSGMSSSLGLSKRRSQRQSSHTAFNHEKGRMPVAQIPYNKSFCSTSLLGGN